MKLSDRLKTARKAKNWTQQQLAQKSGVPQGTISKIERGDQETTAYTVDLADALGVSATWLSKGLGSISPKPPADTSNVQEAISPYGTSRAPLISWVSAGEWAEAVDIYQPGVGEEMRPVPPGTGQHAIWLRVVGDSMTNPYGTPTVPEGSLILVDPDAQACNGRLVVARMEETGEVTFKKLILDAGKKYLKPLNPAYQMIEINGNCRIVGVVTKMEMDL